MLARSRREKTVRVRGADRTVVGGLPTSLLGGAMVDRASRDALAELIQQFVAGRITHAQLLDRDRVPRSKDRAVREIFWNALWGLFEDVHGHRLTQSDEIPSDLCANLARCGLFLKGDLEYEWTPYPAGSKVFFLISSILTLGSVNRVLVHQWQQQGEYGVWPFKREEDYRRALERGRAP